MDSPDLIRQTALDAFFVRRKVEIVRFPLRIRVFQEKVLPLIPHGPPIALGVSVTDGRLQGGNHGLRIDLSHVERTHGRADLLDRRHDLAGLSSVIEEKQWNDQDIIYWLR